MKVTFAYHPALAGPVSRGTGARATGSGGQGGAVWSRDPEHAELEGQRRVVADQGEQLEQSRGAHHLDRLEVLGVIEVAPRRECGGGPRDRRLASGQPGVAAVAHGGQLGVVRPGRTGPRLLRRTL